MRELQEIQVNDRARHWLLSRNLPAEPDDVESLGELLTEVHGEGRGDATKVVERVRLAIEAAGIDAKSLFWTEGPSVNCNDLFAWATSDEEPITAANVELFEVAIADCHQLGHAAHGPDLFACRSRRRRPQKPVYRYMPESLVALFNAAGKERRS